MNSKFYKSCAVPQCASTTIKTPEKLFISVPRSKNDRKMWLQLAGRDPAQVSTQSRMHFCEDHFDLSNDMENYTEYHLMGSVSRVRMRAGCLPTKFESKPDKRKTENLKTGPLSVKRKKLKTIAESKKEIEKAYSTASTQSTSIAEAQPGPSLDILQPVVYKPIRRDKSIQVYICRKSKSTQTSLSDVIDTSRKLCFSIKEEPSESDVSLFSPSLIQSNSSSSFISSQQMRPYSDNNFLNEQVIKQEVVEITFEKE